MELDLDLDLTVYRERTVPSWTQSAKSIDMSLLMCVTIMIHLMIMCSLFSDLCKLIMR